MENPLWSGTVEIEIDIGDDLGLDMGDSVIVTNGVQGLSEKAFIVVLGRG